MKSEISGKKKKKKGEETQKRVCLFRKVRDFILEIERERKKQRWDPKRGSGQSSNQNRYPKIYYYLNSLSLFLFHKLLIQFLS